MRNKTIFWNLPSGKVVKTYPVTLGTQVAS